VSLGGGGGGGGFVGHRLHCALPQRDRIPYTCSVLVPSVVLLRPAFKDCRGCQGGNLVTRSLASFEFGKKLAIAMFKLFASSHCVRR
jgi:hypothetical protein